MRHRIPLAHAVCTAVKTSLHIRRDFEKIPEWEINKVNTYARPRCAWPRLRLCRVKTHLMDTSGDVILDAFQLHVWLHQTLDRSPILCGDCHFSGMGEARIDWQDRLTVETGTSMFRLLSLTQLGETGLVLALCSVDTFHCTRTCQMQHPKADGHTGRCSTEEVSALVRVRWRHTTIRTGVLTGKQKLIQHRYCTCNACTCACKYIASTVSIYFLKACIRSRRVDMSWKHIVCVTFTCNKALILNIQPPEVSSLSHWDMSMWLFHLHFFKRVLCYIETDKKWWEG